jgi:hypothetical protein
MNKGRHVLQPAFMIWPHSGDQRFAPRNAVANTKLIITSVVPNPKRVGSKSHARYATFYKVGQTIGEFIADYQAAGLTVELAQADLCWDLKHKFITIA